MNRSFTLLLGVLLHAATTLAQAPPEAINYNGVARDANGDPVADATIGLQLTITQGDPISGTAVYAETHTTTTDAFGLFNVAIGFGTATSGTFAAIDWSMGDHHLTVALDVSGGTNYVAMGSTQLLSVPYALYARSAGNQQYQTLSLSNDTLYLTNGGFVVLPEPTYTQTGLPTPTVTTISVSNVTTYNATVTGSVTSSFPEQIMERGIVFGTGPNPTLANTKVMAGQGTGTFQLLTSGYLTNNTTYYVRAYATTENGLTIYGSALSFTTDIPTSVPGPGVTYNGYNYQTVIMGNGQEWMAENLRTSSYANGDPIPLISSQPLIGVFDFDARCFYNFDNGMNAAYGKLYSEYAVLDPRNVCPSNWHVPSKIEFDSLVVYWGGPSVAGGALKETGTPHWSSGNVNATNASGFSARGGGHFLDYTGSSELGGTANFFSSTIIYSSLPDYLELQVLKLYSSNNSADSNESDNWTSLDMMSVRCIKD
jgi:uncharacterized protein (TIGR02145 family)